MVLLKWDTRFRPWRTAEPDFSYAPLGLVGYALFLPLARQVLQDRANDRNFTRVPVSITSVPRSIKAENAHFHRIIRRRRPACDRPFRELPFQCRRFASAEDSSTRMPSTFSYDKHAERLHGFPTRSLLRRTRPMGMSPRGAGPTRAGRKGPRAIPRPRFHCDLRPLASPPGCQRGRRRSGRTHCGREASTETQGN